MTRKCWECDCEFTPESSRQFKCKTESCLEARKLQRIAVANFELRRSVLDTSVRNPLDPTPSDLLFIEENL